ncbi:acyl-CoA dehydrogenase family protein [soil metagenome]
MNFDLTEERRMLQDGLRRLLRERGGPAARAEAGASDRGFEPKLWAGLAEMGVIGALFAEEDGWFGGTGFELAVVFEEMGRAGAVDPLLDTGVLGGGLIAALGGGDARPLLNAVIGGGVQLALAHGEPASRYDLARVETRAVRDGAGYRLEGRKAVVVNGGAADHLLVSARSGGGAADRGGISLFLVPRGSDGLGLRDYPLASGGRAAEVALEDVALPASALLGREGEACDAIELAHARGTAAICAEALGLMEAIRELTTGYLKTRRQFGQPIGSFQAIQHRMADLLIEIEQARSAVINLDGHLEQPRAIRERHVSAAKNLIGLAAKLVAEESIQMHGGIGMTMEYELGHLVRRLVMVDHRFGDTDHHLERFIALAAE